MKNDINLKSLKKQFDSLIKIESRHAAFIGIMLVMLTYVFIVWQISQLAVADPSPDAIAAADQSTGIPKVNKMAVNQIQSLEQSNTQVHSLFDNARNNPFQE